MFYEFHDTIMSFLDRGGPVLKTIFIVSVFLWVLLLERFYFFLFKNPRLMKQAEKNWKKREDKMSWNAVKIRQARIAEVGNEQNRNLNLIRTLITLCPLLGILGTVTGMIRVFDVMAIMGTGSAREMADGISMATIPTMAGLVVAISGLFFITRLEEHSKKSVEKLGDHMSHEHK